VSGGPLVPRSRIVWGLLGVAVLLSLPDIPLVRNNSFLFGWALVWGLVGLSVNVLTGYAGQMSLAQAALMGTGAFTLGILNTTHGVPWWVAYPVAGVTTSAVTVLIGVPALRIRGLHLAIVTLGFQFLMNRVVFRQDFLTSGSAGIDIERPEWFGGQVLEDHASFMYVIVVTLLLVWLVDRNLAATRGGRAFYAIREDEQVAASFGISVSRYKLLAFAVSGFYAGLAGALFSTLQRSAGAELYDYTQSLELLVYGVIGGLGSRAGVFVASMLPIFFRQVFQGLRMWSTVLGGVLLILTLTRYRGGLAEQGRELAHIGSHLWTHRRHVAHKLLKLLTFPVALWRHRAVVVHLVRNIHHLPALAKARRAAKHAPSTPHQGPEDTLETEAFVPEISRSSTNGRHVTSAVLTRPAKGALVKVEGLSMRFGGVQALDNVALEVREGEIVGLMGPNGAGKTTLFNCISGFYRPNSGTITFGGRDVTRTPPHRRAEMGFGRTFQNIGLVKSETVLANLMIAQHTEAGYGPLEGMLRTAAVREAEERLRERAVDALERLGLSEMGDRVVHDLPHGLLKVVELGAALVTGPRVLLLDEPSSGMAPPEAEQLGRTLREIQEVFDVTILMIEHHVPLVLSVADYVYVLNFGQILAAGEAHEVADDPEVIAAYLGGDVTDIDEPALAEA